MKNLLQKLILRLAGQYRDLFEKFCYGVILFAAGMLMYNGYQNGQPEPEDIYALVMLFAGLLWSLWFWLRILATRFLRLIS
ncbi:hypothetical protein [Pelagibaculum spongiae]|uniref:Uncharacterized protein n=1 Tax=Pelagibaculum spongiae TaxID=2080658 RepID=A0A2V1GVF9_9GAMM|nr:hypothetical protein [Pelagibaculum spongiae]PVZ63893.1 hypothetical protein DC094_20410 [Pelagibaculum spongiae]